MITGIPISDSKLQKPFRVLISGGSGAGKSTLMETLVNKNHFSSPFDKIYYLYPEYLEEPPVLFEPIVDYMPGLPDLNFFSAISKNSLIIIDDLMSECGKSEEIMKLFSVVARKRNLSIIFLVQNIYDCSRQFRNIRLNATGFFLFNNYAAMNVNRRLLRDLGLNNLIPKTLFEKIYSQAYSYIYVDISPGRQSKFSVVRSNIFNKNFSVYNKMEYIAIPKSEFLKHFKILEAKEDSIRAVKNEIKIKKRRKKRRKYSTETETDSDYST